MADENNYGVADAGMISAAAIGQYVLVKLVGPGGRDVNIVTAATDVAFGVAQRQATAAGQNLAVKTKGRTPVRSGAAIALGQQLMSDATGRAIPLSGATARSIGIAMEAATAADQFISAEILNPALSGPAAT
jgi:hypothetical protein